MFFFFSYSPSASFSSISPCNSLSSKSWPIVLRMVEIFNVSMKPVLAVSNIWNALRMIATFWSSSSCQTKHKLSFQFVDHFLFPFFLFSFMNKKHSGKSTRNYHFREVRIDVALRWEHTEFESFEWASFIFASPAIRLRRIVQYTFALLSIRSQVHMSIHWIFRFRMHFNRIGPWGVGSREDQFFVASILYLSFFFISFSFRMWKKSKENCSISWERNQRTIRRSDEHVSLFRFSLTTLEIATIVL